MKLELPRQLEPTTNAVAPGENGQSKQELANVVHDTHGRENGYHFVGHRVDHDDGYAETGSSTIGKTYTLTLLGTYPRNAYTGW